MKFAPRRAATRSCIREWTTGHLFNLPITTTGEPIPGRRVLLPLANNAGSEIGGEVPQHPLLQILQPDTAAHVTVAGGGSGFREMETEASHIVKGGRKG